MLWELIYIQGYESKKTKKCNIESGKVLEISHTGATHARSNKLLLYIDYTCLT